MKNEYEALDMEIVWLKNYDVITTSPSENELPLIDPDIKN